MFTHTNPVRPYRGNGRPEAAFVIERMVDRINQTSSNGFFDDSTEGFGGNFNLYGVMNFVFIRSALQLPKLMAWGLSTRQLHSTMMLACPRGYREAGARVRRSR